MSAHRELWKCLIRRDGDSDRDPLFFQKVAQQLRELGTSMKLQGIEIVKVRRWRPNCSEIVFGPGTSFPTADVVRDELSGEVPLLLAGQDAFSGALPL